MYYLDIRSQDVEDLVIQRKRWYLSLPGTDDWVMPILVRMFTMKILEGLYLVSEPLEFWVCAKDKIHKLPFKTS